MKMKRYYPWLMAVMGMLVLLVSNGLTVTGLTAFDESLLKDFGWTRSELKLRDLITLVLAGWMAPFLGALIDKVGPRKLILGGIALLAALYAAYAHIHSLAHLYWIHVGFAAVLVAAGLNVAVIFVSQWFATHRGTAIGIALVGTSLGGMVFPKLGVQLMQTMDWRAALLWETAIPLAFLILAFLLVRSPRAGGIQPWGADTLAAKAAAGKPAASSLPDLSYQQAMRTRTFWVLAFVAMTTFFSIMAVASNLFLHMRDLGFEPATAGNGLGLMFGLAMVGKFVFGFLADVLPPKRVFLVNLAIMAAGAVILATLRADLIWYSLALFGLGWGGLYTMIQLLAVNAFGLSSAGKILGTITLLDATTAGLGIWVTAKIFDLTKSYHVAFSLICGLIVLALLAATLVRDERARAPQA
ncbi:MAG: MFS transporter [Stenotrophomonas sp.]